MPCSFLTAPVTAVGFVCRYLSGGHVTSSLTSRRSNNVSLLVFQVLTVEENKRVPPPLRFCPSFLLLSEF